MLLGLKLNLVVVDICKSDQHMEVFAHLAHFLGRLLYQDCLVSKQLSLTLQQLKLLVETRSKLL